jgi:aerobic carbon-monoxide dehydrogenase medium subunit
VIPGPFTYHRPTRLDEAIAILAANGDDARPLAGGHSLIPMMKLRMAAPLHLVDLAGLTDLQGIHAEGGDILIGASVTQAELIGSSLLADNIPIVRETSLQIADPQIRYVGTLGGNVANGDPGNDMPALMQCLDAAFILHGPSGAREVKARDFYFGPYDTALEPGEILTAVRIGVPARGHGYSYQKLKRKIGDYATAAAAVILTVEGGVVTACEIALTNLASTPLHAEDAGRLVVGSRCDRETLRHAGEAAKAITDPAADGRGPAEYRSEMGGIVVQRALAKAYARAVEGA